MQLKRLDLRPGRQVNAGSAILRQFPENLPVLDLLVRESIQNSLDAGLGVTGRYLKVFFRTGEFDTRRFNETLTGLTDRLNDLYAQNEKFIEIRDVGAAGLTGPVRTSEALANQSDHGNFYKLIYQVFDHQRQVGAGGNWGIGKCAYYKTGIGIVVFYTRVRDGDSYCSRLLVSLLEDEKHENALSKVFCTRTPMGLSWWGVDDPEDSNEILPITDDAEIAEILEIFGLSPFGSNETGTSVIIPYVNHDRLNENTVPQGAVDYDRLQQRLACMSLPEHIKDIVQRWYAPRLQNQRLASIIDGGKQLNVYVNEDPVRRDSMDQIFQIVQNLYTVAAARVYKGEDLTSDEFPGVSLKKIEVRNHFTEQENLEKNCAGYLAMQEVGIAELDPYARCRCYNHDLDCEEPIVAYARDPGMVVNYEVGTAWTKGVVMSSTPGNCVLAFFVPMLAQTLKTTTPKWHGKCLGTYIRECEGNDHFAWMDKSELDLLAKIKVNVANKIKVYSEESDDTVGVGGTTSRWAAWLGRKLLPRKKTIASGGGSGGSGGSGGGGSGGGGTGTTSSGEFSYRLKKILGQKVLLDIVVPVRRNSVAFSCSLIAGSESGNISESNWMSEISDSFPFSIEKVKFSFLSQEGETEIEISSECTQGGAEGISCRLMKADGSDRFTIMSVTVQGPVERVLCEMLIGNTDRSRTVSLLLNDDTGG